MRDPSEPTAGAVAAPAGASGRVDPASLRHEDLGPEGRMAILAGWVGLANLVYVLASGIVRQWTSLPDITGGTDPLGRARDTAITGVIAGGLALVAGRLRWPTIALAGLFCAWFAAESLSAWALTGGMDTRPLWLAISAAGLALGVSAARPVLTGWSIFAFGCAYVWANLYVIWRNYLTLGAEFPESVVWWGAGVGWVPALAERPEWAPSPSSPPALMQSLLTGEIPGIFVQGLATNANLTGNFAAFLVVFMVPFLLGRWRRSSASRPVEVAFGRGVLLLVGAAPGLLLLALLDARTAMVGVIAGWAVSLIPLRWSRNAGVATVAAVLVPVAVLAPVLAARSGLLAASGRDCAWSSWQDVVAESPIWGVGPPGGFPGVACDVPWFVHAHNELLQAWGVSGLVGLGAAVAVLAGLGWFAVRFSDRDDRVLLAVVACACLLMGFEVVSSFVWDWMSLGMASVVAISARSIEMMTARR